MTTKTYLSQNQHYQKLCKHFKNISHFEHFSAIGTWDQAAMMPSGGNQARSEAMATLSQHIHQMKTCDWLSDSINHAKEQSLTPDEQVNLREIEYQYQQAIGVTSELVASKTLAASKCEYEWREQRQNNDWQSFKPNLKAVIALTKEEAQMRADLTNLSPYDALINKYEPGFTAKQLDGLFAPLKQSLPQLIEKAINKQNNETEYKLTDQFNIAAQNKLNLEVMELMHFDFNHGRLDISTHPFTGGVPSDVRLTTRFDEKDFTSALMGTIHETGHALYEQGLPTKWRGLPAGTARSMGFHESQSLFCEMQLGRGKGFLTLMQPLISQHLNLTIPIGQLENLYTRVKPSLIRIDADEVTYPCHILLRYEAEKAIIDGTLDIDDLPDFWSAQMQTLLGLNTDGNYKNGCMQDIHWTWGELGYFPSYTLGAMIAAQLRHAMESQLGNLDDVIINGDINSIFEWLSTNIWSKGSTLTSNELIKSATGENLNSQYFEQHLIKRYL